MKKCRIGYAGVIFFSHSLLTGVVLSPIARADDDSFKFNMPSKAPPTTTNDDDDEPRKFSASKVFVDYDYPRFQFFGGWRPGYGGLNQDLLLGSAVASNFSVSNYMPLSLGLGMRTEFTPRTMLDVGINYSNFSVSSESHSLFSIQGSSASLLTAKVVGSYCFYVNSSGMRICPGLMVGTDSFPIFRFVTSSSLEVVGNSDLLLGGVAALEAPISQASRISVGGSYGTGMLKGTSGAITTTSRHAISLYADLDTQVSPKNSILTGLSYESRSSEFRQDLDNWSAKSSSYFLTLGIVHRL